MRDDLEKNINGNSVPWEDEKELLLNQHIAFGGCLAISIQQGIWHLAADKYIKIKTASHLVPKP